MSEHLARYTRQMILPGWGREGQERLARRTVTVIGCGALGSHIAAHLVRMGIGHVILADRDLVEWHNLPRQALYSEQDAAAGVPKAVAAARRLRQLNSTVTIEEHVVDVDADTVEDLVRRADVVFDGTDNFEVRYLVNEACVKLNIPWVYGGVLGTYGLSAAIVPAQTPCLRCLLGPMPLPGSVPTCETAGVLGPVVATVAALEVVEGLKILLGQQQALLQSLVMVDLWMGDLERARVQKASGTCPVCDERRFEMLTAERGSMTEVLCGRSAVQITPRPAQTLDLEALAGRLSELGHVSVNEYLLRFSAEGVELTLFRDGRAIVKGAEGTAGARAFYARYVGL